MKKLPLISVILCAAFVLFSSAAVFRNSDSIPGLYVLDVDGDRVV